MFLGIIYRELGGKHNVPHIHAEYQDYEAVISLSGGVLEGNLPNKKLKLVAAWIEIHNDELVAK